MSPDSSNGSSPSSRRRGYAHNIWRLLCLVLIPYLAVVVLMMFFEERFIFFPEPYREAGAWSPAGIKYEETHFRAPDGTALHGWYFPHDAPRAVVLYSHGNAGNITNRIDIARRLVRMGVSVFLYDYRGYGRSEGRPNEQGILQDARAARARLASLAGVRESEIVMMGRSLGGAVAVDLAAKDGARGLVLESTFTSLPDMGAVHYPWLPVRMLSRNRFDSLSKIVNYGGPLLQSHGDADRIVPFDLGRRLFEASPLNEGDEKEFYTIEEWDHNDPQPPSYYELLDRFVDALP